MINIELLRSKVPEPSKSKDGKSTIASLDGTAEGVGAAIIVAAAFHINLEFLQTVTWRGLGSHY